MTKLESELLFKKKKKKSKTNKQTNKPRLKSSTNWNLN